MYLYLKSIPYFVEYNTVQFCNNEMIVLMRSDFEIKLKEKMGLYCEVRSHFSNPYHEYNGGSYY